MWDRGAFLPSDKTHFAGSGPKGAPARQAERVSRQLSGVAGAGLTHGRDRLPADSGGRNPGSAVSGGDDDKYVSADTSLRTEAFSSVPPATSDPLSSSDKSLSLPCFPPSLSFTSAMSLQSSRSPEVSAALPRGTAPRAV